MAVRLLEERQPGIAHHNAHFYAAIFGIAEVGEKPRVAGDVDYRRIDFEKRHFLLGLAVTGKRSGAQANHADRPLVLIESVKQVADGTGAMVIGQRFAIALRSAKLAALHAVERGAVEQFR